MIAVVALPAFLIGLGFSAGMFFRWRIGLYGLLFYLPFAGAVTLTLHPSNAPKLFKDILFVIPLYFLLFVFHAPAFRGVRIPRTVVAAMLALAVLVLVQMVNPAIPNLAVAIIGAKVWLLYLPLIFVSAAALTSVADFHRVLRLLVLLPIVPCALGLFQYLQTSVTGYEPTMEAWYGAAASGATQKFFRFDFGGIRLYRIPSTFSFVAQYFGFILVSIVPAYAAWRSDPSRGWRLLAGSVLVLLVISGFLSGARAAFVFIPPFLAIILVLEGRFKDVLVYGPAGLLLLAGVALTAGFDLSDLAADTQTRIASEGGTQRPVVDDFLVALSEFPLGTGTGMNTGPARLAMPSGAAPFSIETYYGKAVLELGVPGLFVVLALFGALLVSGVATIRSLSDPSLRPFATATVAFLFVMMVNSLKGWQLDLDPINVYFWVFVGILFRLPQLQEHREAPHPVVRSRVSLGGAAA